MKSDRPAGDRSRKTSRGRLALRAILAAAVAAATVATGVVLAPATASAAALGETRDTGRSVIEVGGEAVVRPGSVVDHVYAVGGDAVIGGIVQRDVVCVGGDVLLLSSAVIQENVVCIGGTVDRAPGAVVLGDTTVVSPGSLRSLAGWNPIRPVVNPLSGGALIGWGLSVLAYVALAAAVAAAAPRPVSAATARIREHPWSSLGTGVLSAVVVVPLVSVVLFVSVIGLPLLVPWLLIVVPIALIVAFVAVSVAIGRLALPARRRDWAHFAAQAALGALVLCLARLIPYAGAAVWLVAWTFGFGAVSAALVLWVRDRRLRRRSQAGSTTSPT